ncbi:peptidoglycan L,D-transpeptidase lipoprotein, YkuD family, SPOR domain-containing [Citrifermentans bemidjiense Bem]|uniref:Peptidoglycan L,D-transpeptidase lipoprotein, YkuD family, SPOR domain-containing n=1 Tax=Citrifermentans bemidjiense (strain ATCC BAA-1014 / DSM 16622 / JCM 12645 / Bem) TaxID=404380 RepID=B5EG67_CITBB|nr:L,D-transpeptidase family protein [Citrifermentans bemidjiense]ACH40980.2 peptidoglycan L,D-transpeptidase lipoprotein, YkuD family, SPOR domain-containing [Citrifermentans bemidjiense Bem]
MHRILDPPIIEKALRLLFLCALVLFLNGCVAMQRAPEQSLLPPVPTQKEIERNVFPVAGGDDVIGTLAVVRLEKGDTLPDIARHFSLGINAISAANPGVDVWVPEPGKEVILPLSFILPDAPRKGIVINLATMRLFRFKEDGKAQVVSTYPVGVGTAERPTPTGKMRIERKTALPTWHVPASIAEDHRKKGDLLPAKVPPGPENPLGERALYLSKAGYLIHGTNKPASIGLKATNGCLRLYPENVTTLYEETPVNTPVLIVNQPYLVGQRDGVLYLEAHAPLESSGALELEKVTARLRKWEKRYGRSLDWEKIRKVQTEARGVPVPILAFGQDKAKDSLKTVNVERPLQMFGAPEVPELKRDAWYVLAANVGGEIEARRLAAIINHQGPPIPARVLPQSSNSYHVIAGPFDNAGLAKEAVRRLKLDLELDGIVIDPVKKI